MHFHRKENVGHFIVLWVIVHGVENIDMLVVLVIGEVVLLIVSILKFLKEHFTFYTQVSTEVFHSPSAAFYQQSEFTPTKLTDTVDFLIVFFCYIHIRNEN